MRLMLLAWTDRIPELFRTVEAICAESSRFGPFTLGVASNASAYRNIVLGRFVEAERDLALARQACEPIEALYVLSYNACFSAEIELILGHLASARNMLESAMNRAIAKGQRYGGAGAVVAAYLAETLYEANELDACEALVTDFMPIVVDTGLPDHLILFHRIAARLHFHYGRRDAGQEVLAELHEIGARRGIRRLSAAAWLEREHDALRRHDFEGARRALQLGGDAVVWRDVGDLKLLTGEIEDPFIARLRLLLVTGQGSQVLPEILPEIEAAESAGRRRWALRLLFLQAQILESLSRRREASASFDTAVKRAFDSGLVRTLLDDSWATESLAARASVANDPGAISLLRELASTRTAQVAKIDRTSAGDTPGAAFQLPTREIQVLRLIWKGHSNKAVARDLFLTENTVETHLRRIYDKLGTRNRTQAAARAREAGAI